MTKHLLTQKIEQALSLGRKAVMPYLPAGYPDKESFWRHIADLDRAGADIIEIGVPFSDPVADGPVVEQAALRCLEQGVSLQWILEELLIRRPSIRAGLVLMGYMNPFLQFGLDRLARTAAQVGVNGLIIADLPLEESEDIRPLFKEQGVALISLVGLNTPAQRLRLYARQSEGFGGFGGFVYFVSVLGHRREGRPARGIAAGTKTGQGNFFPPLGPGLWPAFSRAAGRNQRCCGRRGHGQFPDPSSSRDREGRRLS